MKIHSRWLGRVGLAAAMLMGASLVTAPAYGASLGGARGSKPMSIDVAQVAVPPEEELSMAEQFALEYDVSVEEASRLLNVQAEAGDLVSILASKFGEGAFDAQTEVRDGSVSLLLRTEDDTIAHLAESLADSKKVTLTIEATRPFASHTQTLEEAIPRFAAIYPDGGLQGVYIDKSSGEIVLDVKESSDAQRAAAEEVASSVVASDAEWAASARKVESSFARVEASGEEAGDAAIMRGGNRVTGGGGICTAGFTAQTGTTSISNRGYWTAAHCGTSLSWYANPGGSGSTYGSSYSSAAYNSSADIAYFTINPSTHSTYTTFYGDSLSTPRQNPQSISLALVGSYLCHRGITTGYRCGEVTSNEYAPTWSNACNGMTCQARFVRVAADQAGGDSGGPWLWTNGTGTNRAYGIHKGGASTWSVFSKLSYAPASTRLRYHY